MNKQKFSLKAIKQFWHKAPEGRYLNLKEILNLGAASLGVSFITNLVNMYVTIGHLPLLYNMGQYGTLHATIVSIVSCIGGLILTPLYAKSIQRTKTKFGRYKPYLLILSPIVALLGALSAWSPQSLNETEATIYVYMICIPTLLVWNLWFNTWNFFPGVFTPNQQERVAVWAPIGIIMGLAPTIMHLFKDLFAGIWGDVIAARIFGISSSVLGVLCVLGLLSVKERVFVTQEENAENKISVKTGLRMVFKNKPLIILMLFSVLGCMRTTIDLTWHVVSRIKYAGDMATAAKLCGVISLIVGFAATPNLLLMPVLTRKFNNKTLMIVWSALNTLAYLILAIIGFDSFEPGTLSAVAITSIRFVASFNAMASLQTLMVSEIGDYQQYLTGYRLDGFIQTLVYSVPLVATQLFALIPAFIQAQIGFNPSDYQIIEGATNVPTADMIARANEYCNIAIWISVISGALALIVMFFYPLTKKKHQEIMEAIESSAANKEEIEKSASHAETIESSNETTCSEEQSAESEITSKVEDAQLKDDAVPIDSIDKREDNDKIEE